MRVLSASNLIQAMQPMLKRTLGEDINLKVNLRGNESFFEADEGQFQQIIMNLAVNARDAMPNGGFLSVDLQERHFADDAVQGLGQPLFGDYVQISISDSGIGMTEEVLSHLFEPFFTTKEIGKGTGLGLSIVYAIVKQFSGYITVQSELSKGTVFNLFFPKVSSNVPSSNATAADSVSFVGSGTILLVEDESAVLSFVLTALSRSGYTVLVANNGKMASTVMESNKSGIDLLLTDIVMPDIRGNLVAEEFRRLYPKAPVMFMSGYSDQSFGADRLEEPTALLQEPFSIEALLGTVKKLLEARKV
jgi:two-component system cell cycle sensor histidine kinase/response regulator CckA